MHEEPLGKRLSVEDSEIERIMDGRIVDSFSSTDPVWLAARDHAIGNRSLGWRRLLGRRLKAGGRNGREQLEVRKTYDQHYGATSTVLEWLHDLDQRSVTGEWRDRGLVLTPGALRLAHLLYLARAIAVLRPNRVLEVGCGNGNMLFSLAVMFPGVSFSGVELSEVGVALAHQLQEQESLPASFANACTSAMLDPTAHRRVSVQGADARSIPFADRSFDLVYTRLALEQMEQIRPQVLGQIARISDSAVALIEPWHEFNLVDPARAYIRRTGYFDGKANDLERLGFKVAFVTDDLPQKVQYRVGPVVALR